MRVSVRRWVLAPAERAIVAGSVGGLANAASTNASASATRTSVAQRPALRRYQSRTARGASPDKANTVLSTPTPTGRPLIRSAQSDSTVWR